MLCAAVKSRVTGLVSIEGKLELGEKRGSPNLDSVATFSLPFWFDNGE